MYYFPSCISHAFYSDNLMKNIGGILKLKIEENHRDYIWFTTISIKMLRETFLK